MKLFKKLFPCIIAVAVAVLICAFALPTETKAAEVTSGTCGDNLTWVFDPDTYTLTISGTGPMPDFNYLSWRDDSAWADSDAPWAQLRIDHLVIGDEVTSIGAYAFYWEPLKTVSIGNSVTHIGQKAFYWAYALRYLTIPDSVTTIDDSAFYQASMNFVTIGKGVTYIGPHCFEKCEALQEITLYSGVKTIKYDAFKGCASMYKVKYYGTESEKNAINIESGNEPLTAIAWTYRCEHSYDNDCDIDCNLCGASRSVPHQYGTEWENDENRHWQVCSFCGTKANYRHHTWEDGNCTKCGASDPNATQPTEPSTTPTEPSNGSTEPSVAPSEPQNPVDTKDGGNSTWIVLAIVGAVCVAGVIVVGVIIHKKKHNA